MRTRHVDPGADIGDGPWWIAHEWPERAVDDYCVWSWDCTPCMLHLIAASRHDGDRKAETFAEHGSPTTTTVNAVLIEARAWRAAMGLPPI